MADFRVYSTGKRSPRVIARDPPVSMKDFQVLQDRVFHASGPQFCLTLREKEMSTVTCNFSGIIVTMLPSLYRSLYIGRMLFEVKQNGVSIAVTL